MSAALQEVVMQEKLDLSHQYRENSALKNGLPTPPPRNVVRSQPEPRPIIKLMRQHTAKQRTEASESVVEKVASQVPTWAKGALLVSTLGIGGLSGALIANRGDKPETVQPEPIVVPIEQQPASGDLLRWLKREGYDHPPTPGETP